MNQVRPAYNPDNQLLSVLIYNLDASRLRACLEAIVSQSVVGAYEIIYIDDASTDGAWEVALDFSQQHDGIISLNRNRFAAGPDYCKSMALRMSKGTHYLLVNRELPPLPEILEKCRQLLIHDESAQCRSAGAIDNRLRYLAGTGQVSDVDSPVALGDGPLVSICIFNYNYGRYLKCCLDSVFAQTYGNIEVCFSDNASSDDSWAIALDYLNRYPGRMAVVRNRKNFGSDTNFANCFAHIRGKYFVELCSDDALMPEFVSTCVKVLDAHPEAGYVMVHRTIIDEHDQRTEEPPFYNQSCVISGPEQAAVYMMAAVNPCISQIMYHTKRTYGKSVIGGIASRWYGTRLHDFNLCCEFSMAYIKEPLLLHRLHSQNDSFRASETLIEIIGPYVLQYQYADISSHYPHMTKVAERLKPSINKLATLSLRYCVRLLNSGKETSALRYYHLAAAINPEILVDRVFMALSRCWAATADEKA